MTKTLMTLMIVQNRSKYHWQGKKINMYNNNNIHVMMIIIIDRNWNSRRDLENRIRIRTSASSCLLGIASVTTSSWGSPLHLSKRGFNCTIAVPSSLSIYLSGLEIMSFPSHTSTQFNDSLSGSGDTILHPFIHSQNIVSLTLNQGKPSNRVSNSCSPESSSSGWLIIMMVVWGELRWVELVCFFFFFISLPGGALCRISFSSFSVALQRILFVPYNNKQASPSASSTRWR